MALQQSIPVRLSFGSSGEFAAEVDAARVALFRPGPRAKADSADAVQRALASPIDLPTLDQALVPDDRVVIALDRGVPGAAELIAGIWPYLERRGIQAENLTILQPAAIHAGRGADPRDLLPAEVRGAVALKIHDPTAEISCRYLATTSGGERIHLATELVDADFVLTVGVTEFDTLLGYRGTSSVLFPGLSTVDSIKRTIGQGHQELSPREQRPLRQLVDEIAWLMGIQFSVQVVPAEAGGFCSVLAGSTDAVFARSCEIVTDEWLISMPERVQTVIVAISADASGHGWQQLGRTLAMARQLVEQGGRIVVLSEISDAPGEGIELLRHVEDPENALRPLRKSTPPDMESASQIASTAAWARLFLFSRLDENLVEDLFMYPLAELSEVERIIETSTSCALIGSAQHAFGIVE
ncbi:DUF2088 domain-containing protein [bacterium]|nr:DUF2088 domain-containing protein [bacterium]